MDFCARCYERVVLEIRQKKTPVRFMPFCFKSCLFFISELQRFPTINRWKTASQSQPATAFQFICCFIAGIEQPRLLQLLDSLRINVKTL
ncbi:hypothetical protein D3C87_1926440 [compost metagenome]